MAFGRAGPAGGGVNSIVMHLLVEFLGLLAMIKALFEARGLGKLVVLAAFAVTIGIQAAVIMQLYDGHPSAAVLWGFPIARFVGFGAAYVRLSMDR